jgi:chromate transporter
MTSQAAPAEHPEPESLPIQPSVRATVEVFRVAARLGLTSFGGPVAHLGYFRDEYVQRRRWLDEATFTDLVALSQFLPGPASSKLGISIGLLRAGLPGGLAAWLGFTLPSAIAMVLFAFGAKQLGPEADGWLHGLKVVAVAVVALAVWSMARNLAFDRPRGTIALASTIVALLWPTSVTQVLLIVAGGLIGWRLLDAGSSNAVRAMRVPIGRSLAALCAISFVALLVLLPVFREVTRDHGIEIFDSFYRTGALVFGGGHVVLPLLQQEVVAPGWISSEGFLAGYGAAQAIPGPLFTFASYLGAAMTPQPNGILGAVIATVAIFLPGLLLMIAVLPSWGALRHRTDLQAALRGVNAVVVGILLAALYDPLWTSAILRPADVALGLAAFGALAAWRVPPWIVVVLAAAGGALLTGVASGA